MFTQSGSDGHSSIRSTSLGSRTSSSPQNCQISIKSGKFSNYITEIEDEIHKIAVSGDPNKKYKFKA